jgi:uncharacterized protein (TIGR00730 family)
MPKAERGRYEIGDAALDEILEGLIAGTGFGDESDREKARQIGVTSLRLLEDDATVGELNLVNNALKELRHAFRVFAPYAHVRKVSVFGSARTQPDHPDWAQARDFARHMVEAGWMVITGAGAGIMGAAQQGAGRQDSFGLNIRLPFEQEPNPVIAGDPKLINFRYFFTRKVMFVKEAHAIALFPGGFGTHDEALEALTLMQTGKSELHPVVLVNPPGDGYWWDWREFMQRHLRDRGLISDDDFSLFCISDDVESAAREILGFYSNYHSSRYAGGRLVLRLRRSPTPEELDELNTDFADLLVEGLIEASEALPQERGACPGLPRLVLHFNRRSVGRLRQLIDRLNTHVDEAAASPLDASPLEIVEGPLTPDAELAELEDGPKSRG